MTAKTVAHAAPGGRQCVGMGDQSRTSGPGHVPQPKTEKLGVAVPLPAHCPPALILSPCRHMFRSWPEESAAQWAGSDEPSEGGRAGGGTAGGGLPLNFQHRSVQDGMSDLFQPPPAHSLHAEGGPAQLKSSSERISGQKRRHTHTQTHVLTQRCPRIVRRHFSPAHSLGFHNWNWC